MGQEHRAEIAEAYIEVCDELEQALAANAELAAHLSFAVRLLKGIVGYPAQVEAMEAALSKYTQAKGE